MALPAEIHRFTVDEYLHLVDADTSLADTELVEGVIVDMSPESITHSDAVEWFRDKLSVLHTRRVRASGSIQLDTSLWNPDVYVLKPDADLSGQYVHAGDVLLVVEVSVTTENTDLGVKLDVYGRNGIPNYWVVSPGRSKPVHVFREPRDGEYLMLDAPVLPGGYQEFNLAQWL